MQPFGDLTPPSREFIIAMIEELEQDKYTTKGKFRAVWHGMQERWSFTADGRPVDLSVPADTGMLAELEKFAYVLFVAPSFVLRDYTVLQKAYDQYKLYLAPPPTIDIFLCYREKDTLYHLGALDYRLKIAFGADRVFFAKRGIDLGDEWRDAIAKAIGLCSVMLVLIGPQWLDVTDEKGLRKLDNEKDIVRWEIETALEQQKTIVPVLLEGAGMPREEDLPESLKALPNLQAHRVDGYDWETDTTTLVNRLRDALR